MVQECEISRVLQDVGAKKTMIPKEIKRRFKYIKAVSDDARKVAFRLLHRGSLSNDHKNWRVWYNVVR